MWLTGLIRLIILSGTFQVPDLAGGTRVVAWFRHPPRSGGIFLGAGSFLTGPDQDGTVPGFSGVDPPDPGHPGGRCFPARTGG